MNHQPKDVKGPFPSLPNELIVKISKELLKSRKDDEVVSATLISLRLVCKKLRDCVTPLIFNTRHIMVERTSLDNFVSISQRSHLAHHIRELQFHTVGYTVVLDESETEATPSVCSSMSLDSEGFETTEGSHTSTSGDEISSCLAENTHRMYFEHQRTLMTSGHAYKCLFNAMRQLKNCKKISFDGKSPPWSRSRLEGSFGTGLQRFPTGSAASDDFITRLLGMILTPEVVHGGLQIERLDIHTGYCTEDVFSLRLDQLPLLLVPIESLRRLHLVIDNVFTQNRLQDFLDFLPGLTDFSLDVHGGPSLEGSAGVIAGLWIPKLQTLSLSMVACTADDLENLVCRHQETLKDISFTSIMLPDERSWHGVFEKILGLQITNFQMEDCLEDASDPEDMEELRQHHQQHRTGFGA